MTGNAIDIDELRYVHAIVFGGSSTSRSQGYDQAPEHAP